MASILLTATYNDGLVKDHIISTLAPRLDPPLSAQQPNQRSPQHRGNNSPASPLSPSDTHKHLVGWNNLSLNVEKTKGLIIAPLNSHQQLSSGPKSLQRVVRRAEEIIEMLPRSRMLLQRGRSRGLHTPTRWTVLEVLPHQNQNNYILQQFHAPSHPSSSICYWAVVTFLLHFLMHYN